ncbi:MAG: prolipoprotein diacylglyceryl transferase [Bacillota bacterium]
MNEVNIVEFPKLGLEFTVNKIAFSIFGLNVYWYGIIISIGFITAIFLGMRNSKKFGIDPDNVVDLVLFAAPAAIIGARLYYVIFNWGEFNGDIVKIIDIRRGGLAIYGGLIAAVLVTYIFAKVKNIELLKLLDFGIPYFILAQAIGRWGNFVNQEAFGGNTDLPWGMRSGATRSYLQSLRQSGLDVNPELPVHPAFLYESLWNIGVFLFLIWYRKRYKIRGEVFFLYMILYGIGRAWIESLRTDSLYIGPFRVSLLLSLVFVVVFSIVFIIRRRRNSNEDSLKDDMY